jgi:uroporphyrinogen-III decarboxylase
MTGSQRLMAAIRGEAVDRPPIWLREGFYLTQPRPPADDFGQGWMAEPLYQELHAIVSPWADEIRTWNGGWGGFSNRFLMTDPRHIHGGPRQSVTPDLHRQTGQIETRRGLLTWTSEFRRGLETTWHVRTLAQTSAQLEALAELPWEFHTNWVPAALDEYARVRAEVGERGILATWLSSPIVAISGCLHLDAFLELSLTHKDLFHVLLGEITRRNLLLIDALFAGRRLDTVVTLGGSEQCTPPMMPPRAYDEYVVPYDGQLIARLHGYGVPVTVHCHGKVRRALACMVDMGADATDPVEPPPAGDVTYAQARAIATDKLTLMGNLEFDELCLADPAHIRARVREILSHGPRRLILGASAGPISAVDRRLVENYRAWIEAGVE